MSHDPRYRHDAHADLLPSRLSEAIPPGRITLTQRMTRSAPPSAPAAGAIDPAALVQRHRIQDIGMAEAMGFPAEAASVVQRHGDAHTGLGDEQVRAIAAHGVSGGATALPHLEIIQRSFGAHDVSGVRAHVGGAAAAASEALGADAYATGSSVAFRESPSLFIAAHEAAHVVQQRAGVHFSGAVGQAGDAYEQHADAVAARVVAGQSAEDLLAHGSGGLAVVQRNPLGDANRVRARAALPLPIDWTNTPARSEMPTAPWNGEVQFLSQYLRDPEMSRFGTMSDTIDFFDYRMAFMDSWSEARESYDAAHRMYKSYDAQEGALTPILAVSKDVQLAAGAAHRNATAAFDGEQLEASASGLDSEKIARNRKNPGLQREIAKRANTASNAKLDVDSAMVALRIAHRNVELCNIKVEKASNAREIVSDEKDIGNKNLEAGNVRLELDLFKARSKAIAESVKAFTVSVKGLTDPTKATAGLADFLGQVAVAGAAAADEYATTRATQELETINRQIGTLIDHAAELKQKNAEGDVSSALLELKTSLDAVELAMNALKARRNTYANVCIELAAVMREAAAASGMTAKGGESLSSAVEAMPKIDAIIATIDQMKAQVVVPTFNERAGIGLGMAANGDVFRTHVGILKGVREYMDGQRSLWHARGAAVQGAVAKATEVEGTDL